LHVGKEGNLHSGRRIYEFLDRNGILLLHVLSMAFSLLIFLETQPTLMDPNNPICSKRRDISPELEF
jgi:hypothetical protein